MDAPLAILTLKLITIWPGHNLNGWLFGNSLCCWYTVCSDIYAALRWVATLQCRISPPLVVPVSVSGRAFQSSETSTSRDKYFNKDKNSGAIVFLTWRRSGSRRWRGAVGWCGTWSWRVAWSVGGRTLRNKIENIWKGIGMANWRNGEFSKLGHLKKEIWIFSFLYSYTNLT